MRCLWPCRTSTPSSRIVVVPQNGSTGLFTPLLSIECQRNSWPMQVFVQRTCISRNTRTLSIVLQPLRILAHRLHYLSYFDQILRHNSRREPKNKFIIDFLDFRSIVLDRTSWITSSCLKT